MPNSPQGRPASPKDDPSSAIRVDDVRIREVKELTPPAHLLREFPTTPSSESLTFGTREAVHRVLHGADDRMLVIVGPCSIHDVRAAREYGERLARIRGEFESELIVVMRVYFEKPRTTVGWKGLINDPNLDGSFQINKGLRVARKLLWELNELGIPCGTEYLDMISPQYYADLISWGAIGARTTESQVHRELSSGLSCPVGFKNGTDGNVRIAVDAIKAAQSPHHFLSVTKGGHSAIVSTKGNEDCHIILRGGRQPNYGAESVDSACKALAAGALAQRLMIDLSHGNSGKEYRNQTAVGAEVARQVAEGDERIFGVMLESHLKAGRQDLEPGQELEYGKSITDACLGWEETVPLLEGMAAAVRRRRLVVEGRS
ncbi:MAG: 3-deoxy-7-phosphoheptulonate synthase [Fimbriimonadaceae bacterium]|nr:3-deoxy-7-phosphoheptulonate synthase [Chthonomonadaceae bacterium]MCO5296959.1 3-deoxy-7-phosphoheptulonate synthase [Fimbriimonadaceae bacterium]